MLVREDTEPVEYNTWMPVMNAVKSMWKAPPKVTGRSTLLSGVIGMKRNWRPSSGTRINVARMLRLRSTMGHRA